MGCTMPSVPALIVIGCAGLGLILQIVGVATNGWAVFDDPSRTVKIGLWAWCSDDIENCDETPKYLLACRALGILGVFFLATCVFLGVLVSLMESVQDKLCLFVAMIFLAGAAALSILLEVRIYMRATSPAGPLSYSYSFYLTLVAEVLATAAMISFYSGLLLRFYSTHQSPTSV